MTYEEIIQALRQCTKRDCSSCGMCPIFPDRECVEHLAAAAASLIERLTAENAALREKQRWIPVTERPPEPETDVLAVCNRNGYIGWQAPEGGVRALPKDQGGVCPGV